MQVTELFKLQKHSVYLVRTEVINYYICIPENSYQKTNISIEIKTKMGNYNMDENDVYIWDECLTEHFMDNMSDVTDNCYEYHRKVRKHH